MYTIIITLIKNNKVKVLDLGVVEESIALTYTELLPTKIGSTITIKTFPDNWIIKLTNITKIS